MDRIIIAPTKYIQGEDALQRLGEYTASMGTKALIIADDFVLNLVKESVEKSYVGKEFLFEEFNKECSKVEIERLSQIVNDNNCDYIVGIGGGKTLDTAKAIGYYQDIKVVICPTVASTDAPTSALSVIYSEQGVFEEYLFINSNPDIVLVDTKIIANAPTRLLVAGLGDALSTYFEARACVTSQATTMAGGISTKAALKLAELCYQTLLEDGENAIIASDKNQVTEALSNIVEANTYLSGIGFESSGLAGCHAVHNGLTEMESLHHMLHGEKVAFGVLVQLVLENDIENLNKVLEFNYNVGLPICFEDMGSTLVDNDELMRVCVATCDSNDTVHNMPFEVTVDSVKAAIIVADGLGMKYKQQRGEN